RSLRTRAARAILDSVALGPDWENTADLLHLLQNPLIRNAYAPPGMLQHPAEQARGEDRDEIVAITGQFAGQDSARLAERWRQAGARSPSSGLPTAASQRSRSPRPWMTGTRQCVRTHWSEP